MNNDWTDTLRDKLADHTEMPPEGLWQDIEAAIPTTRRRLLWPWWAAACIALLLGFAFWPQPHEQVTDSAVPVVAEAHAPAAPTAHTTIPTLLAQANEAAQPQPKHRHNAANGPAAPSTPSAAATSDAAAATSSATTDTEMPSERQHADDTQQSADNMHTAASAQQHPQAKGVLQRPRPLDMTTVRKTTSRHLALNVYAAGSNVMARGGVTNSAQGDQAYQGGTSSSGNDTPANPNNGASSNTDTPSTLDSTLTRGVSARSSAKQASAAADDRATSTHASHALPLRVGAALSWSLGSRVDMSAGLAMTRLRSDIEYTYHDRSYSTRQTMYYIGVPVSVLCHLYNQERVSLYLTAGAMAELCVHGDARVTAGSKVRHDPSTVGHVREHRPQFSAFAGAGLQVSLAPHVSIYAEPQINYYPDNGSRTVNIYKDRPLNFDLTLGLRFKLK